MVLPKEQELLSRGVQPALTKGFSGWKKRECLKSGIFTSISKI